MSAPVAVRLQAISKRFGAVVVAEALLFAAFGSTGDVAVTDAVFVIEPATVGASSVSARKARIGYDLITTGRRAPKLFLIVLQTVTATRHEPPS